MATILPITNQCNQNCLFCSAKGRKEEAGKKFFERMLNQIKDGLVISGGEPTLSPDLFWIIKKAKARGLSVELQTNGNTLYYKDLARKLIEAGVDLFNINFPSHLSLINDRVTQTQGFLGKKIEGIKNLEKEGANIRLTHVICALNYKKMEDFVVFVRKNFPKINYIQFSFIKIAGAAKKNPQILVNYQKVHPYLLKALGECQKFKIDFLVDHIPPCYLGSFKNHHIDYQKMSRGEKPKYSLREKLKINECSSCSWFNFCCGIRKDYLKFFGKKVKVNPVK